jgi:hypothetical protein
MPARRRSAVPSDVPFRLLPSRVTHEVARAVAQVSNTESLEGAQQMVARLAALRHPSETVRVTAARRFHGRNPPAVAAAIQAELDREPDVWTPFAAARFPHGRRQDPVGPRQRRFLAWLLAQDDAAAVLPAIKLQTLHVHRLVAQRSPVWSPALVHALFDLHQDRVWGWMAANPALDSASAAALIGRAWATMLAGGGTVDFSCRCAAQLVIDLAARGVPMPGPLHAAVDQIVNTVGRRLTKGDKNDGWRAEAKLQVAFTALAGVRTLTAEDWRHYLAVAAPYHRALATLVQHPDCSPELAIEALAQYPTMLVLRNVIADVPRFIAVPHVRAQLMRYGADSTIIRKLRPVAAPGEVDAYFARVAKSNPRAAARLLTRRDVGDAPNVQVSAPTLQRLLQSGDDVARVATIAGLSHLTVSDTEPLAPLPFQRRPPRRRA